MRQAGAVVVAHRGDEHLRLVFEAAEGFGVNYPVAVDLIRRAHRIGLFRVIAIWAFARASSELAQLLLALLSSLANLGVGTSAPIEGVGVQRSVGTCPRAACAA